MDTILGLPIPPLADSVEFGNFIKSVYRAADRNYLSASHVLKCDPMTIWRIVNGKQKDSPKVRKQWGIKQATQPAPVCPECNEVHLVGWCIKVDGPPIKPKPTYNKKATQPSPDDIVSLTVKMTRAQREQINETAKGRGVTMKDLVISELVESE